MKKAYICNCNHYNYKNKNFHYWENKSVTTDERLIIKYLKKNFLLINKKILHIGIGNSYLYDNYKSNNKIYGITISRNEINKALSYKDKNYNVKYCDKLSKDFKMLFKKKKFDLIIDNNLKSYSCCEISFNYFFKNIVNLLSKNSIIITSRNGMKWFKKIKPKISFNFKNLIHYKIKEVKGNSDNLLSIKEVKYLSKKFSLDLFYNDKICFFKKK